MQDQATTQPEADLPKQTGCCGGPAQVDEAACCRLDEDVKASGGEGCGCASKPGDTPTQAKKGCC